MVTKCTCSVDVCSLSCSLTTRKELRRHVLSCSHTKSRPAPLKNNKSPPIPLGTDKQVCPWCHGCFSLSISLELHLSAKHGPKDYTCAVENCSADSEKLLFNKWELPLYNVLYHNAELIPCPLSSRAFKGALRSQSWRSHLMSHSIAVSSKQPLVETFLRCDLEEICFRDDMIERGKIYMDLRHQAWSRSIRPSVSFDFRASKSPLEASAQTFHFPECLVGSYACHNLCETERRQEVSSRIFQSVSLMNDR